VDNNTVNLGHDSGTALASTSAAAAAAPPPSWSSVLAPNFCVGWFEPGIDVVAIVIFRIFFCCAWFPDVRVEQVYTLLETQ
jgi:hypothetical protein